MSQVFQTQQDQNNLDAQAQQSNAAIATLMNMINGGSNTQGNTSAKGNIPQQGGSTSASPTGMGGNMGTNIIQQPQIDPNHPLIKGLTSGIQDVGKNLAAANPSGAISLYSQLTGGQNNSTASSGQTAPQPSTTQQTQTPQALPQMNPKTGAPSDINQANDPLMNTVQNQANETLNRPNSFLENVIPGLRGAHDVNKLGRLAMAAGIGEKRAAVDYQNLKNMGQEPIQPEQYMSAYAGMYQKTIDGLSQVAQSASQGQEAGAKIFSETADNTRNAYQKFMGNQSEASSTALTQAMAQQTGQLAAVKDFHDYIKNNPINKVMENIKNNLPKATNKDTQASAMGQKIGKYTLIK